MLRIEPRVSCVILSSFSLDVQLVTPVALVTKLLVPITSSALSFPPPWAAHTQRPSEVCLLQSPGAGTLGI